MMSRIKKRKRIAVVFLVIWITNGCLPYVSYALTSGPSAPEVQAFQPAGVSDMVDVKSGDFKYNIPLLDVDGYPLNLSYQSGSGMDDEASWVGAGWSLNTGSVNRQVRGVPDDMSGDAVETDHWTKPMVTTGGRVTAKTELFGSNLISGSASLSYGVYSNNYTGFGVELSANVGMSMSKPSDGFLTGGLGLGISSDSQKGVDATPYASLSITEKCKDKSVVNSGLSASLGYNTRTGLKSLSLGASFSVNGFQSSELGHIGANYSYNTEPISPRINIPYLNTSSTFSIDGGFSFAGVFLGGGVAGYRTERRVLKPQLFTPSYGFLYAENGKNNPNSQMDFIRENENPVTLELPNLAVPVQMPDMFSYTSQAGSGQFRLYRGGSGIFFDNQADDKTDSQTAGIDIGVGPTDIHGGVTLFKQDMHATTHKWVKDNNYISNGDFQDQDKVTPGNQHAYFKQMGDMSAQDDALVKTLGYTQTVMPSVTGNRADGNFVGMTAQTIKKTSRQPGKTSISYLTAGQATFGGLSPTLDDYAFIDAGSIPATLPAKPVTTNKYPRRDPTLTDLPAPSAAAQLSFGDPLLDKDEYPARKDHHISEITVTDDGGKRMVYGLPVYNMKQDEYSFAIGRLGPDYSIVNGNQMVPTFGSGQPGSNKGIDNYYQKETKPPYASSFLLTAILSPDYVDKTGDGITDDDQGTALKFNYSRLPYLYNWRAPYQNATVNRGLLADPDDDKASIVFGKKEIWYVNSIETKTKIVYFITKNRNDGLGASDNWALGGQNTAQRQKCLTEIRLYSKANMTKPIKVVKFQYDYTLCNKVPNYNDPANPTATGGKLTLKKVWFEYQNIDRGKYHPYVFTYNTTSTGNPTGNYSYMSTDRWGVFKTPSENLDPALTNEEYPYTDQNNDRSIINSNVGLFQLSRIDLPTGGDIVVNYESDDYAYVQNRRAMAMCKITAFINGSGADIPATDANFLYEANGVRVAVPSASMPATNITGSALLSWFQANFLDGSQYLYTKTYVNLQTGNSTPVGNTWDFIPCYAKVSGVTADYATNSMKVSFEPITDGGVIANPIVNAVWQRMKNEYPRYAYPGFDNKSDGSLGSGMLSIINATINAATNFRELFKSFYTIARDGNYGMKVDFTRSFVRLTKSDGPTVNSNVVISKAGGGLRVSKVMIDDNWKTLSGDNDAGKLATYGQAYDYTTVENGKLISSGVAAYEPSIGADENPFKQPVPYIQKIKGAINNYFDLEEPFGESVFPSPTVTYSKVTVTDLITDPNDNTKHIADPLKQTGYQVSEFYTSKDFPVRVNVLKIIPNHQPGSSFFSLIKTTSDDELFMSQGYSVELNDMDGRPKAERSYSQAGTQIAATEYYYKNTDVGGGEYALNNSVQVLNPDGTLATKTMGQDIELFTDFREQESINKGTAVNVGTEFLYIFAFGVLLPHIPISLNDDYRLFRSACAFKVIQSSGILDHVVKIQNGSSITTQNIAFDGETGEALITKTQNEFNKNIYSVNIPAYWAYPGMSGAYQNAGIVLSGLTTDATGIIGSQLQFLDSGDELVDLDDTKPPYDSMAPAAAAKGAHYWVVEEVGRTGGGLGGFYDNKYLMNRFGQIQTNFTSALVKMVRPGNRNVLTPGITQIVCLNNPITADNHLQLVNNTDLTAALKVINATATTFDESWASEPPDIHALQGTSPFNLSVQGGGELGNNQPFVYLNTNTYGANKTFTSNDFNASMVISGNYFVSRSIFASIADPGTNTLFGRTDNNVMGLFATFYAPHDGVYYVGFDSNFKMSFRFDTPPSNVCNAGWFSLDSHSDPGQWGWNILPVTLKKGLRTINIEMSYRGYDPGASYGQKGGGIEVYDNLSSEISSFATSGTGLNVIFSTKDLITNQAASNVYTINNGKTYYEQYYTDGPHTAFTPCTVPSNAINPYTYGYRGNWRPYKTKVFEENRVYENILNQTSNKVNIANAGFINNFFTDWFYQASSGTWIENPNTTRWVTSNTVTLYDKFGQQLENKDALSRYSSAQFDFNGQLPGAVASNAMSRELYVNSFEDTRFTPGGTIYADASPNHEFLSSTGNSIDSYVTRGVYHTGNYSATLPTGGFTISTLGHGQQNKTVDYLGFDLSHQYIKSGAPNIYPKGFEPAAKKYLFDVWVKDAKPNDRSFVGITVNASINFTVSPVINVPVNLTVKAQIEDWKLIEGTMDLSHLSDNDGVSPPYGGPGAPLTISIVPATGAGQVYLDDLRIHPYDSQVKSYAYDDQTMRLMAEIDENGFATLYEYDAQGLLVRVKKETEKGIVTLKESRSSYKKIP